MVLPADLNSIAVSGNYVDLTGDPIVGTITFTSTTRLASAATNTAVLPAPIVAALDANGSFTEDLPATDDPDVSPLDWVYTVREDFEGYAPREFLLEVPVAGGPIDLVTVTPADPPPVPGAQVVRTINGEAPDTNGAIDLSATDVGAAATAHTHQYIDITGIPFSIPFSLTGTVTVRTGTMRWYNDLGRTLSLWAARASVGTAPSGSALTVSVKLDGATEIGTVSIPAGSNTALVSAIGATVVEGSYVTVDVTAVGSTTPGEDLAVGLVLL